MNSDLRIPGLATGMDTQDTINKIMKYSRAPLNRLKQDQTLLIWKQEAFRTQNTALSGLRDLVFNLKLESSFGTKKVSSSNSNVVTATANATAPSTSYSVNVTKLASVAYNNSSAPVSIRSKVIGNYHDSSSDITIDANNNTFAVTLDGVRKIITLNDNPAGVYKTYRYNGTEAGGDRLEDLTAAIQTQLDAANFATPVYVKTTADHEIAFYTPQKPDGSAHALVVKNVATYTDTVAGFTGPNTLQLPIATASTINDYYKGMNIKMVDGAGVGQTAKITGYNALTQEITIDANWTDPTGGQFSIITDTVAGTVQAAGTNTIQLDASYANTVTNDYYKGMTLTINGGNGVGQTRSIISYDAATQTATLDSDWTTTPDGTSQYAVNLPLNGTAQAGGAGTITLAGNSSTVTDYYKGMQITITDGTGKNQTRTITGYDGNTKIATMDAAWVTDPANDSEYSISTDATVSNLGFVNKATTRELVGGILNLDGGGIEVTASNRRFKITVGNNQTQEIMLTVGTYATPADFAAEIEKQIRAKDGDYKKVQVTATNYNQIRITPWDTDSDNNDTPLSVKLESAATEDVLWRMGFSTGTVSDYPKNPINTGASLWNQKDKFINTDFFAGKTSTSNFDFVINGQAFRFSLNNTLDYIMDTINSNSSAGVTVYYDQYTDKLSFTTTKSGNNNETGSEIDIYDPNNFLTQVFNMSEANEQGGENAEFTINGVSTFRTENTFTMNGVTYTLAGIGGPATVNVTSDTTGVSAKIEEFVNKYNEVIAAFNTEVTKPRATSNNKYTYYLPLTDEQKEAMNEDEIKAWEEKARQGILRSDPTLTGALREMRLSLSRIVETPQTINGITLSGTINLAGANRFQVTLGSQTREIILEEKSYASSEYNLMANDIQEKLDLVFGTNVIQVKNDSGKLSFTTQNIAMTLLNGSEKNGLGTLGFSNGNSVKASYDRLSQIGITTGYYSENGKLYFDKATFETALKTDPDGVLNLMTNFEEIPETSTDTDFEKYEKSRQENVRKGIFYKLHEIVSAQVSNITNQAGSAGTLSLTNVLGRQIYQLTDRINVVTDRVTMEEERLWKMFTNMETVINSLNSQSAWLSNALGQIGGGTG